MYRATVKAVHEATETLTLTMEDPLPANMGDNEYIKALKVSGTLPYPYPT